MEMFSIFTVAVISQLYAQVKTHLTVHFRQCSLLFVHYLPVKISKNPNLAYGLLLQYICQHRAIEHTVFKFDGMVYNYPPDSEQVGKAQKHFELRAHPLPLKLRPPPSRCPPCSLT